jgi:hypothetical protein
MSLIPQVVKNLLVNPIQLLDVTTFDKAPIFLQPGVETDLLTLAIDEEVAKSFHIKRLETVGAIQVLSTFNTANTQGDQQAELVNWVISGDLCLQFTGGIDGLNGPFPTVNNYAGPKAGVTIPMVIVNGAGVTDPFNSVTTVLLTATGGTAPKINGSAAPVTVTLVNGTASVVVSDTAAGVVNIGMSAATHPYVTLDAAHLDGAVVTLS